MHILFLSQLIPYPPDAGPKVRSYHVLQYLAAQGHEVTLVAFSRPSDQPFQVRHLREYCAAVHTVPIHRSRLADAWQLMRSLLTGQPFLIARDWSQEMAGTIRRLIEDREAAGEPFNAVHADQLWMAPYALLARHHASGNLMTVLDQHNAVFQIPRRLAEHEENRLKRALLAVEERKLVRYETETCHQFDRVVWVTHEDAAAVTAQSPRVPQGPGGASQVIPICVDPNAKEVIRRREGARRVTFLGGLHWPPNAEGLLWFVREIWPQIHATAPDAVLTVIGRNPPAEVQQMARADNAKDNAGNGIEVTGYVDDPIPYLAETGAFIVPLRAGGGMRVKIVDAWAWGLPIVSTSIGAEGLDYCDGENLLVADSAEAFARAVIRVLTDPDVSQRIATSGRHTVEERYDWRKVYRTWDEIYSN